VNVVDNDKIRALRISLRPRLVLCALLCVAILASGVSSVRAEDRFLFAGTGRPVHALIVGIDAYQHVRPLKGAAADARDIESALRRMGVTDVTSLIDAQADRQSVLREMNAVLQRITAGDLVVLSIAGHGAQEPEHVKGSQPDGMDDVFLLAAFEIGGRGSEQRIIGSEFNHFIKEFEARGASVLFVADVCHGGGMVREIDPRAELSFRGLPRYVLISDALKPISTPAEARMTKLDFKNTTFLAAVDRSTKAPEVRIPGVPGFRGALSYAVARAFEGAADTNKDGKVTIEELFDEVHDVVYQLSNQRQSPVTVASPDRDIQKDIAFALRAAKQQEVVVSAAEAGETKGRASKITISSVDTLAQEVPATIKIASLTNSTELSRLERRETPFAVASSVSEADLAWDPRTGDVLSGGDVVAYRTEKADLPSIVDRMAAVQRLKQLLSRSPQGMKVDPDDALHHEFSKVVVDVLNVKDRSLILFDIASDGTIQALYPKANDSPFLTESKYRLPVVVRSPFGADQVVAITSSQRMLALEQVVNEFNGRRAAGEIVKLVERYAPKDARIGSVGIFTSP
jgi:Caspase domain